MSKKPLFYTFLVFLIISMGTAILTYGAQEYETVFNKTYGGILADIGSYAVQTSDNGFMIIGSTTSYGAGDSDKWILKIDSNGNPEWNKTYGTAGHESPQYIIRADEDSYLITGRTNYNGAGGMDLLLMKIDPEGVLLWNRTMGGSGDEWMWEIEKTSDGGYALAGRTNSYGAGLNDYWLLKIDPLGYPMWNVTLGGVEDDRARSIEVADDGGYLVHGWSRSYGAGNLDFWLVKTDENGSPQWNKTYGGLETERGISLLKSPDGGYTLAGSTVSYGAGVNDFYLVKIDENGNIKWNKTFGGELGETAGYLLITDTGGYALVGYTESFGAGSRDIYMVVTDTVGDLLWETTFGGPDFEDINFAIKTLEGGLLVGGTTKSYGNGEEDLLIVKLNPPHQETEPEPEQEESEGIPGFPNESILLGLIIAVILFVLKNK